MKVFDIYSYNDNGKKYRSEGYYINFKRDGDNSMLALRTDINKQTKTTRTINTALPYVIIGLVTLFVIAFVCIAKQ